MSPSSYGNLDGTLPFRLGVVQDAAGTVILDNTDWPLLAANALVAGLGTPALRQLASESARTDPVILRELRRQVNAELNIRTPRADDAAWCVALILCQRAEDGEAGPYATAMRIAALIGYPNERR
ncbi:hypothetical protein [Subtercola frigoramans]|uniref:Uncharacterized protein n=1 Tax=Subtercola frigoramans TaxID=120298 RepID=A0ABS2L1B6_9MICO|nr:hypothetical protein [Subtercola frigoramans]MBM7470555.1 hypothetical protein [Subtercola frigoramans]